MAIVSYEGKRLATGVIENARGVQCGKGYGLKTVDSESGFRSNGGCNFEEWCCISWIYSRF